jgi:hypothetical protein
MEIEVQPQKPAIQGIIHSAFNEDGDPILIGTVTPVQAEDTLTLNIINPGTMRGALSLVGDQVFYTPAAGDIPLTDQVSYSVSESQAGTSVVQSGSFLVEPAPAVTAAVISSPVEVGQQVVIGYVAVTLPHDPLTLTQTSGIGTVSLGFVSRGVQEVIYTAPNSAGAFVTDSVSYTVQDQYGLSTAVPPELISLDPGPAYCAVKPGVIESGQSTIIAIFTPGLPGDTLMLTAAVEGLSLGPAAENGTENLIYTAPAGVTTSTVENLSYTVVDQNLGGNSYIGQVLLDGGPMATPIVPATSVENGQSVVIGSVAPGLKGDTLTLVQGSGSLGTLTLSVADQNGVQQVIYTAPAHVLATAMDSVSYSITDEHNDTAATGSASVQLDRGVMLTSTGSQVLAQGQSAVVDTVVAGLPGDNATLTQTVAGLGFFTLVETVNGGSTAPNQYNVVYTETGAYSVSQRDTATFTIVDRVGGKPAGDTPSTRLDAGAKIVSSSASVSAAPGQTVTIGVVAPGLTGDTLTIAGGAGVQGTFSLSTVTGSGQQKILYTAPSSVATNGTVPLSYTISDETGLNSVSGSSSAKLTNPLPTIAKVTPTVVEKGQSTIVGTVNPGAPGDTLTVAQTSGVDGTINLVTVGGVVDVVYTVASSVASTATDRAGYTVTDEHGGSISTVAVVSVDGGPRLAVATPAVVVQGQSTVIGTVTPGIAGDVETVTQTGSSQGTVTLVGTKVIYTAAANVTANNTDAVSYTIADQHNDATVSGSASVKVLGASPLNTSATVTSTTLGNYINLVGGSPSMTFTGANSVLLLGGSASPTINDHSSGLTIDIGSSSVSAMINNFAADAKGVIDLLPGIGGFASAAAAQAALTSDGKGGSLLSLGGGFIDIAGIAPASVAVSHFKIG